MEIYLTNMQANYLTKKSQQNASERIFSSLINNLKYKKITSNDCKIKKKNQKNEIYSNYIKQKNQRKLIANQFCRCLINSM